MVDKTKYYIVDVDARVYFPTPYDSEEQADVILEGKGIDPLSNRNPFSIWNGGAIGMDRMEPFENARDFMGFLDYQED